MKKIVILITSLILIISCGQYKSLQTDHEINIDELFKSWNKATYNSIGTLAKNSVESQKNDYEKALDLFKSKHDIVDFDKINKNSIRYKFLEKLSNQYLKISDYYIIEADISGEHYQPRMFVMYSRNKKSTDVLKFEYKKEQWEFIDSFLLPHYFKYDYNDYTKKIGKDVNWHDVTITHVVDNRIVNSDLFIKGTMSKFVFELPETANHF